MSLTFHEPYTPYIEPELIPVVESIYSYNMAIDQMRLEKSTSQDSSDKLQSLISFYYDQWYSLSSGYKIFYEEKGETNKAIISNDIVEILDGYIDQIVVAVGEVRKCYLAQAFEHIDMWEAKAASAYRRLWYACRDNLQPVLGDEITVEKVTELSARLISETVYDLINARLGGDSYINDYGKFVKSSDFKSREKYSIATTLKEYGINV